MRSVRVRRFAFAILALIAVGCIAAIVLSAYHILPGALVAPLMTAALTDCALLLLWCTIFVRDEPALVRWTLPFFAIFFLLLAWWKSSAIE
jgi:hypothetical protein